MALPKDPRQLMINLMYLVLTAMLALNITKEVLTAFQTINTSIEKSITSIDGKNQQFYKTFDDLAKDPETKERAEKPREKALLVKAEAEKMMAYLDGLSKMVVEKSGGYETGSNGKQELKGLDNIDVSTKLFVEEKEGATLRKKLEDYKAFLINQIDNPTAKASLQADLPIQLTDLEKSDENPTGDWSFGTFHNIPVVATIAMLSKFKNDVKNSESVVVENLLRQVDAAVLKFDNVIAVATPKTSYALVGQEIEATIILAAYNKTMVTNMGPGVQVKDGVGTMKFQAAGVGMQTRKGAITVPLNGKMESFPYEFNYMVGTAGASLQLDKMNVMYIGVDNPITLSASGYNIEDVSLSVPGANLSTTGKGHYIANVTTVGKLQWAIMGKSRTGGATAKIGGGEIRVKLIPDPTATVGNKVSGLINAAVFKAQPGVIAKLENFDFETQFKVTAFRFMYAPRVGDLQVIDVNGNRFNEACQAVMQRARPGDRVFFESIKAVGPDKKVRSINPIVLTLN
ncbi:gliding motility protein GldM [Taibaiella lutea]|uniref:Gliding motility protein GldM n=1 Tax=Taibaiella lutea TaxID=2608001 RepID=A0A5M6CE19_9BACT|nr:gliding motility protein GldM [Taibaiella lutea]KAA5533223.1 gliding motility protein GldM [Taibaiella lutea]